MCRRPVTAHGVCLLPRNQGVLGTNTPVTGRKKLCRVDDECPAAGEQPVAAGWPLEPLVPTLLAASYVYLVLPYLIFFFGWLKWWLAAPTVALLVLASASAVRNVRRRDLSPERQQQDAVVSWRQLLLLLAVGLLLSLLSGAGGYGAQDIDYPKHNAILKTLVRQPWPVDVASPKGSFPLVYYLAWYLPAGLLGRLAGWHAENDVKSLWTMNCEHRRTPCTATPRCSRPFAATPSFSSTSGAAIRFSSDVWPGSAKGQV